MYKVADVELKLAWKNANLARDKLEIKYFFWVSLYFWNSVILQLFETFMNLTFLHIIQPDALDFPL